MLETKAWFWGMTNLRISRRGLLGAALAATRLCAQEERIFRLERDDPSFFEREVLQRWEAGVLVGVAHNDTKGPVIYTVDRNGRKEQTLFARDDETIVRVLDIAVSSRNEIAFIASAASVDPNERGFIGLLSSDLQSRKIIPTWPYHPETIAFAPDGIVWTIGDRSDPEYRQILERNLLRRYNWSGAMLASERVQVGGRGFFHSATLRASKDRVGWLTPHNAYIEFSLDGSEMDRYASPPGVNPRDTSIAVSDENLVVAAWSTNGKSGFLTLDRDRRRWVPVAFADGEPSWGHVFGFNETTLVTPGAKTGLAFFSTK